MARRAPLAFTCGLARPDGSGRVINSTADRGDPLVNGEGHGRFDNPAAEVLASAFQRVRPGL